MKSKKMPALDLEEIMPLLIGVWRRFHKLAGPSDVLQTREFRSVVTAVQKLQKGLETGHDLVGKDYFSEPDLLGAYILYQWVLHYQQGMALMGELPNPIGRVLDIGSGPGAFAFAASKHGAREVVAIDRNHAALQMAAEICGRSGYPLSIRRQNAVHGSLPVDGRFDLIVVGHCLQELFPETQRDWVSAQKAWIERLFNYLTPQGCILFVDHSLPSANQRLLSLRDQLVKADVPVQAPCVWKGDCPALAKNTPCYAQRACEKPYLVKEIQRAAQINLNSLKMSYLIVRNREAGWPALPDYPVHRVISPPIEGHTGKRFYLCGTEGKADLGSHVAQLPVEARAFDYLKRGELISFDHVQAKQHHFDIILGSRVRVEAALNKPLPYEESDHEY